MMWPRKIPKEPDFYTHSKWKKGNGICHAEQQDLPEIILHGKTIEERIAAIKLLEDESMRAHLACRVDGVEETWHLISGIRNQFILYKLAADPEHEDIVRLYAMEWIYEPETLRLIADTESSKVRAKAFERIVDIAETPERLKMLANDDSLPLYNRMMAALKLTDGPAILELYGTGIYQDSDIVRSVIDKIMTKQSKTNKESKS